MLTEDRIFFGIVGLLILIPLFLYVFSNTVYDINMLMRRRTTTKIFNFIVLLFHMGYINSFGQDENGFFIEGTDEVENIQDRALLKQIAKMELTLIHRAKVRDDLVDLIMQEMGKNETDR